MAALYDRIVSNEIKMRDESLVMEGSKDASASASALGKNQSQGLNIFNTLLSLLGTAKKV
jgi:hypothetical protein